MTDLKKLEWMRRGRIAGWIAFLGLGVIHTLANSRIVNEFGRGQISWWIGIASGILFWNLWGLNSKISTLRKSLEGRIS